MPIQMDVNLLTELFPTLKFMQLKQIKSGRSTCLFLLYLSTEFQRIYHSYLQSQMIMRKEGQSGLLIEPLILIYPQSFVSIFFKLIFH